MGEWPEITEPLLRERQGMSDEEFLEFLAGLLEAIGTRELEDEHYERAIGYPWERPPGSCLVTDEGVKDLADIDASRRIELVSDYVDESADRVPLLAYGANGSPERLALKLAHLPDGHREALILAGDLEDFDVGAAAQPPAVQLDAGDADPEPRHRGQGRGALPDPDPVHGPVVDRAELQARGLDGHHTDRPTSRRSRSSA